MRILSADWLQRGGTHGSPTGPLLAHSDRKLRVRILSADWVVPVEGEPVADGAVAIDDDGRIAAVGAASELGEGERFDGCVIVPGFVNCHTHLEYAVYAGFGDGLPFVPWIGLHIQRKNALTLDDMRAIAEVGARECLRSGVTTVGDCSFVGAAAEAAAATGLRAIVFLEVFGGDATALERFHENAARIEPRARRPRPARHLPARALHVHGRPSTRPRPRSGSPVQTHLAESAAERPWLVEGSGDWTPLAEFLVPPPGETGIRLLSEAGLLGPHVSAAHCVHVDEEEIELLAADRVGVAHCPRSNGFLGCGAAPLLDLLERGDRGRHRHRQPRLDAVLRSVRGAPDGDRRGAGAGAASRRADRGARARARDARRRTRARPRARGGLARARQVGRPRRRLARRLPARPR